MMLDSANQIRRLSKTRKAINETLSRHTCGEAEVILTAIVVQLVVSLGDYDRAANVAALVAFAAKVRNMLQADSKEEFEEIWAELVVLEHIAEAAERAELECADSAANT
jgi:hypothetical protein